MNKQAEETVLKRYPYKTLSNYCDATNYVELAKVRNEVYKNLTAINSALNRAHGHLGLAMPDPAYTNQTGAAFIEIAVDLGSYDLTIATNTGSVTRVRHKAEHLERREANHIQQACKTMIKHQLERAIPKWLLNKIENCITGLKNVSIINIFDHCFDQRSTIDDTLIMQYTTSFPQPISVAHRIRAYIDRQKDGFTSTNPCCQNRPLPQRITTKKASFGANMVEEEQGYALEEAMENLAYAAMATNMQVNTLTKMNAKLAE
eukprot:923032-Ditylum_brightwellii.AAC.2